MNSWDLSENQLSNNWQMRKEDISSTAAYAYMFQDADVTNDLDKELKRCLCSFNDAVKLYEIGFKYNNIKTRCPFFYYEINQYVHSDDDISLNENGGYTSFHDIHRDNKTYTVSKKYIVYTLFEIVYHIEHKLGISHYILKSPLDKTKYVIRICDNNNNTIKFLRSDTNSIEWDDLKSAAATLYTFYKQYFDKDELRGT